MRSIVFKADLFATEADRLRSQKVLLILLDALVASNVDWLQRKPGTPGIYQAGVRYRAEAGTEEWKIIPECMRDGLADCEDLAAWLCAELRVKGVAAKPYLEFKRYGNFYLYHVMVKLPNGEVLDPSRRLGMGKDEF